MLDGFMSWPAAVAARYRSEGYWRGETLWGVLQRTAEAHAQRVAIVAGERRIRYGELLRRAERLAAALHERGIARRDRVIVQLPNLPEFVELCFALFRLGAIPVLALPAHRKSEIRALCESSGAVGYAVPALHQGFDYRALARELALEHVLVAGEAQEFVDIAQLDAAPQLLEAVALPEPEDVALFLLSGGTTGMPKLIPRTHDDYAYNVRVCAELSGMDEQSVQLIVLPMAHNGALGCPGILGSLYTGGCAVLANSASPDDTFPLIERERVTLTTLVPPLALVWTEAARDCGSDLSSLQLLQVGGAKLNPELARRVRPALGCALQQWFGMSEGILCCTRRDDPDDVVIATQGRPVSPADELRIVDDDGCELPSGSVGNLLARGPTTFCAYFHVGAPCVSAVSPEGFFPTGDLARLTARGDLVVEGRTKDVINRGGEKVPAQEVENLLLGHPAVRDVALVAMPDPMLGERTCAFVVPRAVPPTLVQLHAYLREQGLAAYKLPDRLEIADAFPTTNVGKISKSALRERINDKLRTRT